MSIPRLAAEEVVQAAPTCVAEEAVSERSNSDVVNNEASNLLEGNPKFIKDEIKLTEMSIDIEKECAEDDRIKIEGKFKNPKFRPWTKVNPEEEVKIMWEAIKNDSKLKGIEEIGEASATFEHCFEFWGTWRVMKPGLTLKYLENSENWTQGINITKVEHA